MREILSYRIHSSPVFAFKYFFFKFLMFCLLPEMFLFIVSFSLLSAVECYTFTIRSILLQYFDVGIIKHPTHHILSIRSINFLSSSFHFSVPVFLYQHRSVFTFFYINICFSFFFFKRSISSPFFSIFIRFCRQRYEGTSDMVSVCSVNV